MNIFYEVNSSCTNYKIYMRYYMHISYTVYDMNVAYIIYMIYLPYIMFYEIEIELGQKCCNREGLDVSKYYYCLPQYCQQPSKGQIKQTFQWLVQVNISSS